MNHTPASRGRKAAVEAASWTVGLLFALMLVLTIRDAPPGSASHTILIIGLCVYVGAITADNLRHTLIQTSKATMPHPATNPQDTPTHVLDALAKDVQEDAAHRAARDISLYLAEGGSFLTQPDLWHGYTTGEATHHLTHDAVLHFHRTDQPWGEFTLLTSDGDQLPITRLDQIHHALTAPNKRALHAA